MYYLLVSISIIFSIVMIFLSFTCAKKDNFKCTFYFVSSNEKIKNFFYIILILIILLPIILLKNYGVKLLPSIIPFLSYFWMTFIFSFICYVKNSKDSALALSLSFLALDLILTYIVLF